MQLSTMERLIQSRLTLGTALDVWTQVSLKRLSYQHTHIMQKRRNGLKHATMIYRKHIYSLRGRMEEKSFCLRGKVYRMAITHLTMSCSRNIALQGDYSYRGLLKTVMSLYGRMTTS